MKSEIEQDRGREEEEEGDRLRIPTRATQY